MGWTCFIAYRDARGALGWHTTIDRGLPYYRSRFKRQGYTERGRFVDFSKLKRKEYLVKVL